MVTDADGLRGMMGGGCKSIFDLLDDEHLTVFLMGKTAVSFTKGDHEWDEMSSGRCEVGLI